MKKIERKYVVGVFVLLGVLIYGVSAYVNNQQADLVSQMRILIAQQETTLTSLAEVTDRNGADSVVSRIIKDCVPEDRQRFDTLLSTLNTLNHTELVEVDQLFDSCGDFFAERKALMTARLDREYEVYADYISLLNVVDSRTELIAHPLKQWSELVSLELERSELSTELVVIQKDIILALLEGVSIQSDQMLSELVKAQEAQDTLSYTGVRIDSLREDIMGL